MFDKTSGGVMRARTGLRALTTAVLLGSLITACGGGGGGDAAGGGATATGGETPGTSAPGGYMSGGPTTGTADGSDGSAAMATTLGVADTDLGKILVDGKGMTLYMFTKDSPGTSTCEGDCLVAWPPLKGTPTAGQGVDKSLLGTTERSDGTVQATYNDWPLYYWQNDTAPGDTTGQNVNEVWFVLGPDGEPIMTAPSK
jgi:predicted lipoprotein with Yx(FWY)xxD motif